MKKTLILLLIISLTLPLIADNFSWFSQSDSRWNKETLGSGHSSIGSSGCVLSCLSMLLNAEASNPHITPDRLNDWLQKNGGYAGNDMRWQIPGEIDGSGLGLELVAQINKKNDWDFLSAQLDLGNKVIVKVAGRRSHWVLVVKRDGDPTKASSYVINDPGMDKFEERTLAHFGGFLAARSYSGNWLGEESFELESEIYVVPVQNDEFFLYDINKLPHPADVYVTLQNKLPVEISGYFILGLFDANGKFLRTVDYEYATVLASNKVDLLYELPDVSPLNSEKQKLRIVYSKYFSDVPSMNDTTKLIDKGIINQTSSTRR
ncbi:MAG: hypothetical protein PHH43_00340 [Candidatus Cloacimonetes bacterium]|nr:hypothetical protein [Candidatus Cloacimonadota bacterium]